MFQRIIALVYPTVPVNLNTTTQSRVKVGSVFKMKKSENPKIVCSCRRVHTCGIVGNVVPNDPPQHQDIVENMSLDTDSNSSAATNAGNETIRGVPLINEEDSGFDTLNVPAPSVTSEFSSTNTSPDMDLLHVPSALGTDTTPDTDNDTSSGMASLSASSSVSDPHSISAKAGNASTGTSPGPSTSIVTDTLQGPASNPETPKHEAGGSPSTSQDDSSNKSPSRPTSFTSGLRRTYTEFSKTDADEDDDSILKCVTYVTSEDMVAKKTKTEEDSTNPKGKSTSSSSGSRSRTGSTSRSVESRDTSVENLSGLSADTLDDNDWYTKMRTRGPKISITGSVRPDGTIDETEEHRSSSEGGQLSERPVGTIDEMDEHRSSAEGGSLLSVNPPPGDDICENILFDRKSPSLAGDEEPPKQDEKPQRKKDDTEEKKDDEDA